MSSTHDPCFFGYGSLVNRATHAYHGAARATANGWARTWCHAVGRDYANLTAIRVPDASIHGLIAGVPGSDWVALDARENAYERHLDTPNIAHERPETSEIAIYAIAPEAMAPPKEEHPILLSYLDVVVQGYLTEFGPGGPAHFFETTLGWDATVLDDRADPIYPRYQVLSVEERAITDLALDRLGVRRIT